MRMAKLELNSQSLELGFNLFNGVLQIYSSQKVVLSPDLFSTHVMYYGFLPFMFYLFFLAPFSVAAWQTYALS